MSKTIRIDDEVYARLGALSTDFDSPSETIRKIVLQYETTLAADLIRPVIEGKKENLIAEEKLGLKKCSFTVLHHIDVEAVKSVMESMGIGFIFKRESIMNVRIYCRASTEGQHADRALVSLREFARSKHWSVAGEYIENASGAKLERVELMHLLAEAQPGDLLLIEAIDRLSRLQHKEWAELKATLNSKGLVIASMDLPTSWQMVEMSGNDLTSGILRAVNAMLIDILATMARQDYETRRKRQAQGIERAKAEGLYTGKEKDMQAREVVREMLAQNVKAAHIMKAAAISRATFYRIKKELVS